MHSSSARDAFPARNNKSRSCKIGHVEIFGLVCVVDLNSTSDNSGVSYFQHYLR